MNQAETIQPNENVVSDTHEENFNAEVGKVLQLVIHSIYTNKEIFLRELISNASDACDKLRYLSISDPNFSSYGNASFKIQLSASKDKSEIIVHDNGIGMSYDELKQNLGTIAKSGTQAFVEQMTGDNKKDNQLIGQFGVGFYSAFMVADYVKVISLKAGENQAHQWESDGKNGYKISKIDSDIEHGTKIILSVKSDKPEFLDHFRLKNIVKNYSDHISIPIFYKEDSTQNEVQINSCSALWTRNKSDITDEQYQEFYKSVSYSADTPWITLHNRNEGMVEFTNLLFVPKNKTFDLFHPDRRSRVKLYIKKVFITDEGVDLVPKYMRFLRGVVDCEDLPLNISRETLQHNPVLEKVKSTLTNKVLSELKKQKNSDFDSYVEFWNNFGAAFKEGLCEHTSDHDKILDVCIFKSALHNKYISLEEYIKNMHENQKKIYFFSGDNEEQMKQSPHIEGLISKKVDVLLLTDSVDDFWTNIIFKYKEHDLVSATKSDGVEDLFSDNNDENSKDDNENKLDSENSEIVCKYFKQVLGDTINEVKVSKRLNQSPVCLVSNNQMDMRMERFLLEQKQLSSASKKNLEINIQHPIVQSIVLKLSSDISNKDGEDATQDEIKGTSDTERTVKILFTQSCIIAGEPVANAKEFTDLINSMLLDHNKNSK